jgi:hypothetical protein
MLPHDHPGPASGRLKSAWQGRRAPEAAGAGLFSQEEGGQADTGNVQESRRG